MRPPARSRMLPIRTATDPRRFADLEGLFAARGSEGGLLSPFPFVGLPRP